MTDKKNEWSDEEIMKKVHEIDRSEAFSDTGAIRLARWAAKEERKRVAREMLLYIKDWGADSWALMQVSNKLEEIAAEK